MMIGAKLFGQQPAQQPQFNAMSVLDMALNGGIKQSPPPQSAQ